MAGRNSFERALPFLRLLTAILYIFPKKFIVYIWFISDVLPRSIGAGVRYSIAVRLGATLGHNVLFGRRIYLDGFDSLVVGSNVSFHDGCYIDARGGLVIADDVSVAHQTTLITFEHSYLWPSSIPFKYQPLQYKSVSIGSNVWIGAGVRVLAGASIGSNAIIAAGSVAKGMLRGERIWGGAPARILREL